MIEMSKQSLPILLCILALTTVSCLVKDSDNNPPETPDPPSGKYKSTAPVTVVLEGYSDRIDGADDPMRKAFFHFSKGAALATGPMLEAHEKMKGATNADIEARFGGAYDIFFDADHGIATNAKVAGWELGVGGGGIVDMGETKLDHILEAPEDGYKKVLEVSKVLAGHTYCVRTSSGKHYGKFHIVSYDKDDATLEITWFFQFDGSRSFKSNKTSG